jgi:spermidine/putrescine transport system ATP-binding protein
MAAMIELRDVRKRYGTVEAVRAVSLSIGAGEIVTLLGPSGSGKTTLLRLIAGFETPDSGSVWLDGKDVTRVPPYERDVHLVFQSYALFPHLSVADNVAFGLKMQGVARAERETRVREAIELVQIEGMEKRRPSELSGGQRQRVALARALVCRPKVLLLDEPLSALDAKLREAMQVELKRLQHKVGITFVFVTHDQESALVLSDRIAVVNEGRIEQEGSVADVYDRPRTAFVASFIGDANMFTAKVLSSAGNRLRLSIGKDVEIVANCPPGRVIGAEVTVAIRPEKIHFGLEREEPQMDGTFVGIVEEEIFRGPLVQLFLRTEGGVAIETVAAARTADRRTSTRGDRVRWWVNRDDVVVVE